MFKNINYIQNHIKYYWLSGKKIDIIIECPLFISAVIHLRNSVLGFFPSSVWIRDIYTPERHRIYLDSQAISILIVFDH